MPGVVGIMTAKDIKGANSLIDKDQPVLCTDIAPVLGASVAIVAARTREEALAAAEAVKVDYEVLPRVSTPAEALAENAPEVHPGTPNLRLTRRQIKKGFDKIYQVDNSLSRKAEGTGLGLSIVKFIVDAHKGKIDVESKIGKGSKF
jgi:CO/xanthine dehydrogenase Mo-binding subunit